MPIDPRDLVDLAADGRDRAAHLAAAPVARIRRHPARWTGLAVFALGLAAQLQAGAFGLSNIWIDGTLAVATAGTTVLVRKAAVAAVRRQRARPAVAQPVTPDLTTSPADVDPLPMPFVWEAPTHPMPRIILPGVQPTPGPVEIILPAGFNARAATQRPAEAVNVDAIHDGPPALSNGGASREPRPFVGFDGAAVAPAAPRNPGPPPPPEERAAAADSASAIRSGPTSAPTWATDAQPRIRLQPTDSLDEPERADPFGDLER